jgi:tRNA-2-methylthio-N6-dimethylallyladenosine synthase
VPEEVKKRRNNDLLAVQTAISQEDNRRFLGRTVEVLVEGPSKTALKSGATNGPMQLTGRTMTDHIVVFDGNPRLTGQLVRVEVQEATAYTLFGEALTGEQVGVADEHGCDEGCATPAAEEKRRFTLPVL